MIVCMCVCVVSVNEIFNICLIYALNLSKPEALQDDSLIYNLTS